MANIKTLWSQLTDDEKVKVRIVLDQGNFDMDYELEDEDYGEELYQTWFESDPESFSILKNEGNENV